MSKDRIVNAGIRITRNCNMKCNYCNIQYNEKDELSLDEWKKAVDIIKDLGVQDIVLLGGEPTLYPHITELVHYITKEKGMNCNLTTNAFKNRDKVVEILEAGLTNIGVSVDNLNIKDSISPLKAKNGLDLIDYLISLNRNYSIVNYTVLNKKNVDSVLDLIKHMNSLGVATYILPFHWGNEGTFEHRKNNEQFAFITDEDLDKFNKTVDEIIKMKKEGYKINNAVEFFEAAKKHIKNLDWKCTGLSELRMDSDGKLVCCCDNVGKVNEKYTIFNIVENMGDFLETREGDCQRCKGCLWPSSFEAEVKKNKMQ